MGHFTLLLVPMSTFIFKIGCIFKAYRVLNKPIYCWLLANCGITHLIQVKMKNMRGLKAILFTRSMFYIRLLKVSRKLIFHSCKTAVNNFLINRIKIMNTW